MNVSIVIPAHDAAETIAETLASLIAQSYAGWEAIVVDDGSSDGTVTIATSFAERDARIRVISQPQGGVSAARNAGIALARYNWLLFLDADDWLLPRHLQRLTDALVSNPALDAAHCKWNRVLPDGTTFGKDFGFPSQNMFPAFAHACAFQLNTCILRQSLVEDVGRFDISLGTCEDWDLLQRVARTGARFGMIAEVLAGYRMRPDSVSVDGRRIFQDGLRVLTQGHSPDPRVQNPHPAYVSGLPAEELPSAKLRWTCWPAGLMIGRGDDARPLLDALQGDTDPNLDPEYVAQAIFEASVISTSQNISAWAEIWPGIEQRIDEFLLAIEVHSMTSGLARRARTALERLILDHSTALRPLTIGGTHEIRVEVTEPIPDMFPPPACERLRLLTHLEGVCLGTLELPICDGLVPAYVITDAIAAEYAWSILGRFFEHTVYRELEVRRDETGVSIWRGNLRCIDGLPKNADTLFQNIHNLAGWTIFLQELWARSDWPVDRFYKPESIPEPAPCRKSDDGWVTIEVSEEVPYVETACPELNVVLSVGGVTIGAITVPVEKGVVHAGELRMALTGASGFELCRAVVREGLLGQSIAELPLLRGRLVASVAAQAGSQGLTREMSPTLLLKAGDVPLGVVTVPALAPGSASVFNRALLRKGSGVIFGRRSPTVMGTSASRRAILPAAAARELISAATVAGEPVVQFSGHGLGKERAIYVPELIWCPLRRLVNSAAASHGPSASEAEKFAPRDRHHFEMLFAARRDPWKCTSLYGQTKYEQTLALLPSSRIKRALELGCAEGHFTMQLAPRIKRLVAADISQIALSRAAERCAELENLSFMQMDLRSDPLPGKFELIVCSEVLYYACGRNELQLVARKLANGLKPNGYLITVHMNLVADDPDHAGYEWDLPFGAKSIGEVFTRTSPLRLVKELRTPLYRIQLFKRVSRQQFLSSRGTPKIINFRKQPIPVPPEVAAHVLRRGGRLRRSGTTDPVVTERLPILMYHRVTPGGSSVTTRCCVTLEAFERQLRYLRDAGYYSVSLEQWRLAMELKSPLPGRAVILTFDDGYFDFISHAWPLLKRYGFSATIFLVTDEVGGSNRWGHVFGEQVPLLGWNEIRYLQREGVEFGSHSASHPYLTALSAQDIVREGARSRARLECKLGVPVQTFAYPYGAEDGVVRHLIGASGYVLGLSRRQGHSCYGDPLLALPRIEVTGFDRFEDFIEKLNPESLMAADR